MMNVAVLAEHNGQSLNVSTLHAITAALNFSSSCSLVVIGCDVESVISQAQSIIGVTEIRVFDGKDLAYPLAEDYSKCLNTLATEFDVFIAPANTFGKNILPRFAATIDVNAYSDVISIKSDDVFVRPVYAGNILQTIRVLDDKKVLSIRTTAFEAALIDTSKSAEVVKCMAPVSTHTNRFINIEKNQSSRPELSTASKVVSGGRGLQSREKFKIVEELADKIGASVGASRAAVDAGFVANDLQVGQTGKVVAPELYIALGISGAIQHLAGMKDSKIIVAINKDPEAPIFQIASYGLIGDVFEIVPELISKI